MDNEIKEAVKFYKNWKSPEARTTDQVERHNKVLLDLAQKYLAVSEGMSKELQLVESDRDVDCSQVDVKMQYNQAIQDCTLFLVKKLQGIEDVQLPYPATFTEASPDGTVNKTTLSYESAQSLREYFTGEGR